MPSHFHDFVRTLAILTGLLSMGCKGEQEAYTCYDSPGWVDSEGNDCAWYAEDGNCIWGLDRRYENYGFTATEACCSCGTYY